MTAVLRSRGAFTIRYSGNESVSGHIAIQISRNLHQYFYADSKIVSAASYVAEGTGNVITLGIGSDLPGGSHPDFPIQIAAKSVTVRDARGLERTYGGEGRISAIFLRPLGDERLELVVWGSDGEGLAQAARLVPMLTGVGQPDFVVLDDSARWKGVDGALALGFLDHSWEVTPSSVV